MKISVNWVKQFTDVDIPIDELVEKIGRQLGAVEEVIDVGKKYQGIVVAKVVTCEKHADADKLSVCMIDDGGVTPDVSRNEQGYVQVVCGAPNVREGLNVAWLPPGSTVPNSYDKDPFVLEARELRGVISNGMIASSKELAIGDDHGGIVEIDIEAVPGTDFAKLYELNDYIIDIENKMFTHRPDCFGVLGVAREIAGIQGVEFKSPDWYQSPLDRIKPGKTRLELTVKNEAPELVPRFMAVALADVTIKPSPLIIQSYLSRVGLKPISNIVDVTNYLMMLTGQPIHAYDYDKVKALSREGVTLIARVVKTKEDVDLLNGKTAELENPAIVIATDVQAIGVAGVMGGADTEVGENTKNIILECATFDMYSIRRTSMKNGLFTDAVTRFNKGQSPLQNDVVLEEAVATIQYVSGAHVASDVFDIKSSAVTQLKTVELTAEFVNARLGLSLEPGTMAKLLENVEFSIEIRGDALKATPPYWRTDIEIKEDIVEEIGRLYGFDKLPMVLPKQSITPAKRNLLLSFKSKLRDILSEAGANEVLTYSFVHGKLLDKVGQERGTSFRLSNALSPDLQYYRLSLIPSLLDKVHANIKAGYDEFALYEVNKTHNKPHATDDEGVPKEFTMLALAIAANDKLNKTSAPYYSARKYLDTLAARLGFELKYEPLDAEPDFPITRPYDHTRSALVYEATTNDFIGLIGEFKSSVKKSLKLPSHSAGFELDAEALLKVCRPQKYKALSKYPGTHQDMSLKVSKDMSYHQLYSELQTGLRALADDNLQTELTPLDIYQKGDAKHFTFRLYAVHHQKTLQAVEINDLLDKLAAATNETLGSVRI
ncbi:phenylalanine--tRNA ligase subunit beta [Candidatus Saccharibacteria bacterium]|nr:phenylalanine--tRNA ligase subunit beta [Candidatus Saccharibacteria bacterium]